MDPSPAVFWLLSVTVLAAQGAGRPAIGARGSPQPLVRELAGKSIGAYPYFQHVRTFNEGEPVRIAVDTRTDAFLAKRVVDAHLLAHEDLALALAGETLGSLAVSSRALALTAGGVKENIFLLDAGTLKGAARPDAQGVLQLGRGYDVVLDLDRDGRLEDLDVLDGSAAVAGFHVVEDFVSIRQAGTRRTGPYEVTEVLFNGGTNFTQQDIYFPSEVSALGALPLVVVSHGNGHNYQWYDHVGEHLASWGYVVMSHANNTVPGPETAAGSTLRNTELLLASLATIAGGALQGHVDGHRIVWIGHSRGGEGVARAYLRLAQGTPLATLYTLEDVKLVSSIAPTDFLGPGVSDMGAAPYHLWTGGADADVNGCADCDICQTFHLLERADGTRFSTSLHGAGHGDFHAGGGSSVAAGPCRIGRERTHRVMRAYLLPLLQHVLDGNPAALDYLTRQWEEFRALGAPDPALPEDRCVVVDLMFVPGPERQRFVIDDFQSEAALERSSAGGAVRASPGLLPTLAEGRLDDANASFTASLVDRMNGMTLAGPGDSAAGLVLEWNGSDEWLSFELPRGQRDLRAFRTLSFRAAQSTRDEITVAELGDLDFTVELHDEARRSSSIRIGVYGGGVEEPYQRGGCGSGNGWANEFESVRIPLEDFRRDGRALDLGRVVGLTFLLGPRHGSPAGRLGLDEILLDAE
jgi:hypothetical protein